MNLKTTKLRDAITFALVAGTTSLVGTGVAVAQDSEQATTLDRISVTGSRIRQVDIETSQPVLSITRDDIEAQGLRTVADLLQTLSAAGSPAFSRSSPLTSNQEAGGSYISLRGLGAQRTLVLVNGKRLAISPNGYQDISAIPTVMVERIDVLKDGASSIYGSDAMAGVINIITRQNFEGAEANVYHGQYSDGDGAETSFDFVVGMAGERGSITIGAEQHEEDAVWARDRWFSRDSYPGFPELSTTVVGQWGNYNRNNNQFRRAADGSLLRYAVDPGGGYATDGSGAFILDPTGAPMRLGAGWSAPNRGSDAIGAGDFHPQNADDTSVPNDQMHLLTPLERRSVFANINYDLTDNVRFTSDILYTKRESNRQIAGYPTQSSGIGAPMAGAVYETNPDGSRTLVSNGSYFNPNGNADLYNPDIAGEIDPTTGRPFTQSNDIDWRRRGWEVPRTTQSDVTTWQFSAALQGAFEVGDRWFDWDAGMMFAQTDTNIINNGNFHIPSVRAAVGPSFMNDAGQIVCGTPGNVIDGCVPWNPFAGFGTGAVANSLDDPAVVNYLFKTEHAIGNTETRNYFANLTGSLFTLPAGDLAFAVGIEHRKEEGGFTPDAIAQSGDSTNLASGPTWGQYELDEAYLELNVPVLADMPFARELSLSLASRYSDYDTFGDTVNSKFGLAWRPSDDLLVRGTWSEGFRAPTIGNLYGGGSQTFTTGFADPCDSVYGVAANTPRCLQDVGAGYRQLQQGFVPTDSRAAQTPVPFTSGSNINLQPENSETKTVGFVYSPSYVEGLSLAVDWWNIRIENTMVSDHPNTILEDCYVNLIESRCAGFVRDPSQGNIVGDLTYGLRNSGFTETEGFDFEIHYLLATGFGNFSANWQTTYVSKYESAADNDPDTRPTQYTGIANSSSVYFRLRSNLNLNWSLGDFSANWGVRYHSGVKEQCQFDEVCDRPDWISSTGSEIPMRSLGSNTFHDIQLSYNTPWRGRISVGANNVFNHTSAPWYTQTGTNFSYYGGFDLGRFVFMRYQQRF